MHQVRIERLRGKSKDPWSYTIDPERIGSSQLTAIDVGHRPGVKNDIRTGGTDGS
jgi:hypothetical protein